MNYELEKRFYNKAPAKLQSTFCLGHLYTGRILVSGEHNIGHPGRFREYLLYIKAKKAPFTLSGKQFRVT